MVTVLFLSRSPHRMSRSRARAKSWIVFASGTARPAIERTGARGVTESAACPWHGLRSRRAAVAIVMLALAIGGTTALYSVIDAVLVRPLPYQRPRELVALHDTFSQRDL